MAAEGVSLRCGACGNRVPVPWPSTAVPVRCARCGRAHRWDGGVLVVEEDGADRGDYPDDCYPVLAEVEPRHFWFRGRNRVILEAIREVVGPPAGRSVLDVGCGTGFVLAALEAAGMRGCGVDMHLPALRIARTRVRGLLLRATAAGVPFREQFDAVLLCDVIEHAADDAALIREASLALAGGGALVVTVPAHEWLWTVVDEVSRHKRRYTARTLRAAMEGAGLRVRLVRYFGALLLPVQALQRRLVGRGCARTDADRLRVVREALRVPPAPVNALLGLAMTMGGPLGRFPLGLGTSLIAVGVRP
jgi:SAM-dependent methyltransferase